jgi:hypothetical protein
MEYDLVTGDGRSLSRRIFLKGVGIACLGVVPILQACDSAFSRDDKGSAAAGGPLPRPMRPPIDVSVPAKTRTATFSLG